MGEWMEEEGLEYHADITGMDIKWLLKLHWVPKIHSIAEVVEVNFGESKRKLTFTKKGLI